MPKHPRTKFADNLVSFSASAAKLGYRMPAEWEPMVRIWLTPPHNDETWPGCLPEAQKQFEQFMAALMPYVEVATTQGLKVKTVDSWIRDYGPIFVVQNPQFDNGKGAPVRAHEPEPATPERATKSGKPVTPLPPKAAHDFHFNGWGGKYEARDLDDVVPQHIAKHVKTPLWIHDMVLEGGSIDVNGIGTVMTTEQCLLNKNRNPRRKPESIVNEIHAALGTSHVIWLPGGIVGDDTDGHIDDIARFINIDTVVAVRAEKDNPDFKVLDANWKVLAKAKDQDGKKLNIIPLPAPKPILYNFPADRFGPGGLNPVPASYANFLIANGVVVVPIFGQKTDDVALKTLEQNMPGRKIVGVRADSLVVGLGSFHCLSQQEPA